jgi:3(or 17)beta-hydroxysteroid dehydrogenase
MVADKDNFGRNTMGRLDGKIALVTGGARGIGRAAATRLSEEGASVVITDMNGAGAEASAGAIGGNAEGLQHDVRSAEDWQRVMDHILARFGRLDIQVNNAGILATANTQTVENTDIDQWRAVQGVNVEGVYLGCQFAIATMKRSGGGSIVNLSSIAGLIGTPHLFAYGASKGAVRQLTKSVAVYCGRAGYKIRCNSVHPGLIQTDMGDEVMGLDNGDAERNKATRVKMVPLGYIADPVQVANCILFLASDESSYVTGAELVVDGGFTAV